MYIDLEMRKKKILVSALKWIINKTTKLNF